MTVESLSRSIPRVPKYRLHRPTNQAVVTIAGRDYYLGKFGSPRSKSDYRRLVSEFLAPGGLTPANRENPSVAEVCAAYASHAKIYYSKNGKPTSEVAIIKQALLVVSEQFGHHSAPSFGPLALRQARDVMVSRGWSRKYINRLVQKIKAMYRWAVTEELVSVTVYQALAAVPGLRKGRCKAAEPEPVLPVCESDISKTVEYLPNAIRDMVLVQRLAGMRPMEVCAMRPVDIDRSKDVWEYRPNSHKSEHHARERRVFLGPRCQEILETYLDRPNDCYLFSPQDVVESIRAERSSRRATPIGAGNARGRKHDRNGLRGDSARRAPRTKYDTTSYGRAIRRACQKSGTPTWSPNQLRHTAGTQIRKRFGIEAARTYLGHSELATTEIYAERDWQLAADVARQLG